MTSPWRARARSGVMVAVTPVAETTWRFRVVRALALLPAAAVRTVDPGDTAVTTPSLTRAARGFELVQVIASSRASPATESAVAASRRRWPASIFDTAGVTDTRTAAPGVMRTSIFSMIGRPPGTTLGGDRIYAIDVSDPAKPVITDSIMANSRSMNDLMTTEDGKWMVFTREGAADRKNGIVIASTADPAHPKAVSEFTDGVTAGVHSAFVYTQPKYGTHVYLSLIHI